MMKEKKMDDYIKRSDILGTTRLLDTDIVQQDKVASWLLDQILYDIEHTPAADAAPVIRCKDCKYWSDRDGIYTAADGVRYARCRMHNNEHLSGLHEGWCPKESCYCSLGERKENINGNQNH